LEKLFLRKKIFYYILPKFKNIYYYSSKILHRWNFKLKGTHHTIELYDSRLSGKKKLMHNDTVIVENNNSVAVFNYSFQLDGYYFNLVQIGNSDYDLKINGTFFKEIMEAERSGDFKPSKKEDYPEESQLDNSNANSISFENNINNNTDKNNLID